MASLLQKVATAVARPFTRHLRIHLDEAFKKQQKVMRAEIAALAKRIPTNKTQIEARLLEHSRYMAENLELLCSLQTSLCEKQDILLGRVAFPVDPQRVLVKTAVGYMICSRLDVPLVSALTEAGELEPGLRHFLDRHLGEGMTFVDVGAHIGMHTVAAARSVGRKGRVHAFEASPGTAQYLLQNVSHNGLLEQTSVHPFFAGAATGTTPFYLCPVSGRNSKFNQPEAIESIQVRVVTVDEALAQVAAVDLIKVDVGGTELEALSGMRQLLGRSPDASVLAAFSPDHLERSGTHVKDWGSFCEEHGFEIFLVEDPSGSLRKTSFAELMTRDTSSILMARGKKLLDLS